MTLNQLGYFYQAAVLQHFNQAAEKINISEPSLSRSITALENELGVTLFERMNLALHYLKRVDETLCSQRLVKFF